MSRQNKIKKTSIFGIIVAVILLLYTISLLTPLVWGCISSFKDPLFDFDENYFGLPKKWIFDNYEYAVNSFARMVESGESERLVYMPEMYLNTVLYSLGSAIMMTLTPCVTAYAVAKYNYKPLKIITYVVIVCITLPVVGNLPSEIQVAKSLGIYDTLWGMWIMKSYFITMYYLVFLATFSVLPNAYMEAAKIDGASNFRIFLEIMLPLVKNTFFAIVLIKFIENWNDYQTPLLLMPNKPTISLGLYYFVYSTKSENSNVPTQLTGCIMVFVPVMLLYIAFNNRLIGNISMGGIKG